MYAPPHNQQHRPSSASGRSIEITSVVLSNKHAAEQDQQHRPGWKSASNRRRAGRPGLENSSIGSPPARRLRAGV